MIRFLLYYKNIKEAPPVDYTVLIREMRAVGNSLNQLARVANPDNLSIKNLKSLIKEIDEAIENMWLSIEKGGDAVALTERINRRQAEKEELEEQLAIEQNKRVILNEAQILAFLNYVCEMPGDDMAKRRAIINIFVHSVYLYDDHLTLIINASNKPVTIDDIPLDDIEAAFNGEKSAMEQCSNTSDIVPPKAKNPKLLPIGKGFGFFMLL